MSTIRHIRVSTGHYRYWYLMQPDSPTPSSTSIVKISCNPRFCMQRYYYSWTSRCVSAWLEMLEMHKSLSQSQCRGCWSAFLVTPPPYFASTTCLSSRQGAPEINAGCTPPPSSPHFIPVKVTASGDAVICDMYIAIAIAMSAMPNFSSLPPTSLRFSFPSLSSSLSPSLNSIVSISNQQ